MPQDKRASQLKLAPPQGDKDTPAIARGLQGVALGTADTRPLCEHIPPGTMAILVCCDFMPTRQAHLYCYTMPAKEPWSCAHERCFAWSEEQAKRMCPYDDTLPEKLYDYLDAMFAVVSNDLLNHINAEAKQGRPVDAVAWLREHGDVLLLNYMKWNPETREVYVQSNGPPIIEWSYVADKIAQLEKAN